MTRSLPYVFAAATLLGACRGTEAPAPTAPPASEPVATAPAVQAPRAQPLRADGTPLEELERASTDAFGLPVPRGTTLIESVDGARHFRTRASLDQIIGFFDANTPGGVTVEHFERGARLVPRDAEGRAVFAYYDQTPAVFTLSYLDTEGRFARRGASSADGAGAAADSGQGSSGASASATAGEGDRIVPSTPPASHRSSAAEQAQFLREQMGSEVSSDDPAARMPAPVSSPVVGGGYSEDTAGRSYRPPLRFVRGVREPRQNPDAMF